MEVKKKVRAKHVGFAAQREFCRNNDHTYTEKFSGEAVLFCNYPFPDPYHKKGVCRANTCTDMREIPQEITEADEGVTHNGAPGDDLTDEEIDDAANEALTYSAGGQDEELQPGAPDEELEKVEADTLMPCPSNE